MKKDQIDEGKISDSGQGLGTPTREMVRARAREIAELNGRSPERMLESDFEQAWGELTGRGERAAEEPEGSMESYAQWSSPGTPGHKAEVVPAHDEQTDVEKLTEEGVREAEHDRMVEGTERGLREERE